MNGWQHRLAFVVQFRPETNIEARRLEGRVEHIPTSKAARFNSLDELLGFIASTLAEDPQYRETLSIASSSLDA